MLKLSTRVLQVSESGIRKLFDLARKVSDVISFGIGEPDYDTPAHIKEAAKKALDEGYTHYTPNAGFPELREEIANKLRRENSIEASPDEVMVTSGGTAAIFLALSVLVDQGDHVLTPDPGFVVYEQVIKAIGGKPVKYQLRSENFDIDLEDLEKKITDKTKCIIVNTPSNPTGAVHPEKTLREVANIALQHEVYILSDEVYEKFIYDGEKHFSIASIPDAKSITITVNSFSKTYAMCGWRIGYFAAEKAIVDEAVKLQQYTLVHAPSIAQKAALAALRGPQDHITEMVREYDKRRRTIVKLLNEVDGFTCPTPKGAFYAFPKTDGYDMSSYQLAEKLLKEAKVATVPGIAFGERGEKHLRFAYTIPVEKIVEGIERVKRALKST
ncbi:MAG: pyridoxal phosphate-dependent aminotransferase [Candidatus Methanomethylicota archaeon]|uniref:Aminotransferase n=1 Tax=Thermoproteota archaeon TaxID=2056631 RepID=A0A497EWR2_9CREN|nr:MAG: pyridoxal phosphate-dependent aminotransferase [Candidatus Verstraetearchaeota archaeon]